MLPMSSVGRRALSLGSLLVRTWPPARFAPGARPAPVASDLRGGRLVTPMLVGRGKEAVWTGVLLHLRS